VRAGGLRCRLDSALVRVDLRAVEPLRADQCPGHDGTDRERGRDREQYEDRHVVREHAELLSKKVWCRT
jgi:hypothetical protein